jgi:hypothetical protein
MAEAQTAVYQGDLEKRFEPFEKQMRSEGVEPIAIDTFKYYFSQLLAGQTGMIDEDEITPLDELPDAGKLAGYSQGGRQALAHTVIIK